MIIELENIEDFDSLIKSNRMCVVKFWADWCKPCKTLDAVIDVVHSKYSDILFLKVNVEAFPSITSRYFVTNLPTMLFMKEGNVSKQLVGNTSSEKLSGILEELA